MSNDTNGNTYIAYQQSHTWQNLPDDTTICQIAKLDANGEILWKRTFMPINNNHVFYTISNEKSKMFIKNNYLYLFLMTMDSSNRKLILSKYDFNGNIVAQNIIYDNKWVQILDLNIDKNYNTFFSIYHKDAIQDYSIDIIGVDTNLNTIFNTNVVTDTLNNWITNISLSHSKFVVTDSSIFMFSFSKFDSIGLNPNLFFYSKKIFSISRTNSTINWKKNEIYNPYNNPPIASSGIKFFDNKIYIFGGILELYDIYGNYLGSKPNQIYSLDAVLSEDGVFYDHNTNYLLNDYSVRVSDTSGNMNISFTPTIPFLYKFPYNMIEKDSYVYINGIANDIPPNINGSPVYIAQYEPMITSKIKKDGTVMHSEIFSIPVEKGGFLNSIFNVDYKGDIIVVNSFYPYRDSTTIQIPKFYAPIIRKICYSCEQNIQGKVYVDNNQNCIDDSSDTPVENNLVELVQNGIFHFSDSTGSYSFSKNQGATTLKIISKFNLPLCDSTFNFISSSSVTDTVDFAYKNNSNIIDGKTIVSAGTATPGFVHQSCIKIENISTMKIYNSLLKITLPTFYNSISISPIPDSTSNGSYYFKIDSMNIGNQRFVYINATINPSIPIGTPYNIISEFTTNNDQFLMNNIDTFSNIVIGSFDPNEKTAIPIGREDSHLIENDTRINYTIHFQNTGTDTALNIKVYDELDANLDISTLQINGSSHPMTYKLENRTLKFYFNNISLPDSNANQNASNGFLSYSITPKPNINNIKINNKADIYFDYNIPITTNTTFHNIVDTSKIIKIVSNDLSISPNPSKIETINFDLTIKKDGFYTLYITDIYGRIIDLIIQKKYDVGNYRISKNFKNLSNGLYIVNLFEEKNTKIISKKLIILK